MISYNYSINNTPLNRVRQIKNLGVSLDCKMISVSTYIDYILNKSNKMLGFLMRICKTFQSEKYIKSVYFANVYSSLNFASVIWSPYYRVYKTRIER